MTKNNFTLTHLFYATKHWKIWKTIFIQSFSLKKTEDCLGKDNIAYTTLVNVETCLNLIRETKVQHSKNRKLILE